MTRGTARAIALISSLSIADCAGTGGGATPGSMATPAPPLVSIQTPVAGSIGPGPVPSQPAIAGGPSFTGASGTSANTSFPVLSASQIISVGAIAPDPALISVTAMVIPGAPDSGSLRISIPSLNFTDSVVIPNPSKGFSPPGIDDSFPFGPLDYVALAQWADTKQVSAKQAVTISGFGVFGFETPATAMPASGLASFSGIATGVVYWNTGASAATVSGDTALSVDFASGKVTGGIGLEMYSGLGGIWTFPWNGISVSASIAQGTNTFAGTMAVSSPAGPCNCPLRSGPMFPPVVLSNSATGLINGAFYGPAAQDLGAVWSIKDSNVVVLGGIAASSGH